MGRIALSFVLGLCALIVTFVAGALVAVPGQDLHRETIVASLAAFLYLAVCQFLVARRDSPRATANWPTMVALGVPLLAICLTGDARDTSERVRLYGPIAIADGLGIAAGVWAARRVKIPPVSLEHCRRSLRASATLLGGAALVLAAAAIPLTKSAGTFPDGSPGSSVPVFWVLALLSLFAAALAFIAGRPGQGHPPSPAVPGPLAFLAFVPAWSLVAPALSFLRHGPVMVTVSVLLFLCMTAALIATALLASTALRLTVAEPVASAPLESAAPVAHTV